MSITWTVAFGVVIPEHVSVLAAPPLMLSHPSGPTENVSSSPSAVSTLPRSASLKRSVIPRSRRGTGGSRSATHSVGEDPVEVLWV